MSYYRKFEQVHRGDWETFGGEKIFTFLNYISPTFEVLVIFMSFLFIFSVYRLIKSCLPEEYMWMGVFVFVISPYIFLVNLSAMRQCLTMVLFIFAIRFSQERKMILYCLTLVLASGIHKSAIALIPVYFFATAKPFKRWQLWVIGFLPAVLLMNQNWLAWVMEMGINFFEDKNYTSYYTSGAVNSVRSAVLASFPLFFLLVNSRRLEGEALVCSKLSILSYLISIIAVESTTLIRIRMYFEVFSVVAIPYTVMTVWQERNLVQGSNAWDKILKFFNLIVFPAFILVIYLLKYYSFFQDPTWATFSEYQSILSR